MIGNVYVWRGAFWRVLVRGAPFDRGPRRNVLLEQLDSGERVVRPFRGLRRASSSLALARPPAAVAWELRAAWATGRRVSLSLAQRAGGRVEGHVHRIAATDAFVVVAGLHIPLQDVLAVHHPSRLGDSTAGAAVGWRGRARRTVPQHEELWAA